MTALSHKLDEFYNDIGIGVGKGFRCCKKGKCSEACMVSGQPTVRRIGPIGSSVGGKYKKSRYKSERIPGLVFLSQGPVISSEELKRAQKTGKNISKASMVHDDFMNEPKWQEKVNNPHWKTTKEHGLSILSQNGVESLTSDEVSQHICNVNSVKCRTSASRTKDPDAVLFGNCQEHIIKELEFLEPDIIIAQGNRAWSVLLSGAKSDSWSFLNSWPTSFAGKLNVVQVEKSFEDISYELDLSSFASDNTDWCLDKPLITKKSEVVIIRFNGKSKKTCLCLWTHHSSYGHHHRKVSSRGVKLSNGKIPSHKEFNTGIHPLIVKSYLRLLGGISQTGAY